MQYIDDLFTLPMDIRVSDAINIVTHRCYLETCLKCVFKIVKNHSDQRTALLITCSYKNMSRIIIIDIDKYWTQTENATEKI